MMANNMAMAMIDNKKRGIADEIESGGEPGSQPGGGTPGVASGGQEPNL